jgi:hypothetical protein
MRLSTRLKHALNAALGAVNLKVETLTSDRAEAKRLNDYARAVGFDVPVYALSPGMAEFSTAQLEGEYDRHRAALERLRDPQRNDTGYAPGNTYFESPDAEILYLMMRRLEPRLMIEVGCGNSTRVARQAILDGGLGTKIVAVDPQPRADIARLVDRFEQARLESLSGSDLFAGMGPGDILFIDSSHEVRAGGDVAHLFGRVIPVLPPGVVIHIHDIFLPFEYPENFIRGYPSWGEQYVLHALLGGGGFEILWPGHYLQRTRPEARKGLPFLSLGKAQSFWIRKVR